MDNVSVRDAREFLNLSVEQPRMHLLDEPTGYISAMGKSNLGHQMRYSVERLEAEVAGEAASRACSSWSAKATSASPGRGRSMPTASSAPTEPARSPVRASAKQPMRSWACAAKPYAPPPSPPAARMTTTCCAPPEG